MRQSSVPDIAIFSGIASAGDRAHGGITRVVTSLADAFADSGRKVELVTCCPCDPRPLLPRLHSDVEIHNLGAGGRIRHLLGLANYLRRRTPRALLAAGQRSNLLAAKCERLLRPPSAVVLSVHNSVTSSLEELRAIKRRFRLMSLRSAYAQPGPVVCVSRGVAEDVAARTGLPVDRFKVIYNPIVTPRLLADAAERPNHPWLESGQPPVVLGAGRLTRQKDFPTLIQAFARVARRCDCKAIILGEGSERKHLERLITDLGLDGRIDLPGFADNPFSFMHNARLFVLSSAWEGFGNVLVESMAVGTPVVSTDCPSGPREILRDGALGGLVPPGDPVALAEAIISALERPCEPELLRRRAADFRAEIVAERYLEVLLPVSRDA